MIPFLIVLGYLVGFLAMFTLFVWRERRRCYYIDSEDLFIFIIGSAVWPLCAIAWVAIWLPCDAILSYSRRWTKE